MKNSIKSLNKVTAAKVTALLSAAIVTAPSMSGVTAYAEELPDAYNAAELAEEVLAPTVADPTKFDFFGNYILTHDEQGSPEPQIINNGDGTYNIIMYVGQSVMFPVNNPWADMGVGDFGPNRGVVFIVSDYDSGTVRFGNSGDYPYDTCNNFIVEAKKECAEVYEIGVTDSYDNVVSNTVTVGLFVLPAVPGAQEPTLTQDEIEHIQAMESNHGAHKEGAWATGGGHF